MVVFSVLISIFSNQERDFCVQVFYEHHRTEHHQAPEETNFSKVWESDSAFYKISQFLRLRVLISLASVKEIGYFHSTSGDMPIQIEPWIIALSLSRSLP